MSNLTQNRGTITFSSLNNVWFEVRSAVSSVMPPVLQELTDTVTLSNLQLFETDPEAAEVVDQSDIPTAFIHKAIRLSRTSGFAINEDGDDDVIIGYERVPVDTSKDFFPDDYDPELDPKPRDRIPGDNEDDTPRNPENPDSMDRGTPQTASNPFNPNSQKTPDYGANISRSSKVNFDTNEEVFSYLNVNQLAQKLTDKSARLVIGNEDSDFIDINLDSSSSDQLLANSGKSISSRKPLQTISVLNDRSIFENTFLQLNTGDRVPISLIPKTTLQKALAITQSSNKPNIQSVGRVIQKVGQVVFNRTTFKVSSTERFVLNSSGQGWFSLGYLGGEQFNGLGFDEWAVGDSRVLTSLDLGIDKRFPNAFGNTLDDWYVYDPVKLTEEQSWHDYSEGITPKKPNCDTNLNDITEDISSQQNGITQVFTLSQNYETGTLKVYWNGQRQSDDTITELSSTTFRTSFVPTSTTVLLVDYTPL